MSNLYNQNIGQNYRGILNLDATTINTPLDATLRAVTDGTGTSSPLQLSTTSIQFGSSTGLFWNNTTSRLGLGTNSPLGVLHLKTTGATTRLLLDGDAAQSRIITYRTSGIQRFGLYTNNTAESGANAGSDFAIRAYSDTGTLLSTPIFIKRSSGNVGIGTTTPSARLNVRGDGTNPIARFESSAGTRSFSISASGDAFSLGNNDVTLYVNNGAGSSSLAGSSWSLASAASSGGGYGGRVYNVSPLSATSGTTGLFSIGDLGGTFSAGAGSGNFRPLNLAYTINNSGAQTGNATGLFLNATETALNGMSHNLMDLQRGGVSQFLVTNGGTATFQRGVIGTIQNNAINNFNNTVTMFTLSSASTMYGGTLFQLAGTTNAFPAIKRNGTAIDFRLADDSAPCDINASKGFFTTTIGEPAIRGQNTGNTGTDSVMRLTNTITNSVLHFGAAGLLLGGTNPNLKVGNTSANVASAIVEIISTTQGFLPPRQTTTQINAIVSPAEGLVIYNTTISHLCVYQGGGWVKINHSPM
jgi:hypothetical protein